MPRAEIGRHWICPRTLFGPACPRVGDRLLPPIFGEERQWPGGDMPDAIFAVTKGFDLWDGFPPLPVAVVDDAERQINGGFRSVPRRRKHPLAEGYLGVQGSIGDNKSNLRIGIEPLHDGLRILLVGEKRNGWHLLVRPFTLPSVDCRVRH